MNRITFTKEGFEKAEKELEKMYVDRVDALFHLKKSREMGDLSENGYYKASRMKLTFLDRQIRDLKYKIKLALIIQPVGNEIVGIGNSVVLAEGKKEYSYKIVGDTEANPGEGKISLNSPLGHALNNKKIGDKIELVLPGKTIRYKLLKIT